MPELVIHGVPVRFPFEPYEVQRHYMEKVIECLQQGSNGILESPTGTGKTLCLLCATLGWLEVRKAQHKARFQNLMAEDSPEFFANLGSQLQAAGGQAWGDRNATPKIIYSSRTHSQLTQAIQELKRTTYKHFKVSVLGSREQMCIHPEVSKETNNNTKVHMCQSKVKAKTCYFNNMVDHKKEDSALRDGILDLEDLVKLGKKKTFCPYYMARELKQDADIIFMPYNYLLDPKSRKAHGVELQGNVVIFDEAHNIEKMCEDAASLQIRSTDLALCIDEVTQVMKKMQELSDTPDVAANDPSHSVPDDFSPDDLYTLKALFLELEKAVDGISLPTDGSGVTFPGSYMFELLEKADITYHKKSVILEVLEKLVQYLTTTSASPFQRKGAGLQKFADLIKIVFSKDNFTLQHMNIVKKCYKVHISLEDNKWKGGSNKPEGWGAKPNAATNAVASAKLGKVISYWCFSPGFGMKDLAEQGVKTMLLTSGTLSPLETFSTELQVPFPVQLSNPHIIGQHQVWVGTVCKGPDGVELNSSFQNRSNPKYLNSLGQTVLNLARIIPDGLLIFFPSYPIMKKCQEEWQVSGIWARISATKPIYVEPQNKDAFQGAMSDFYQNINDPNTKGACFMAVCRGKVSEGLDFADRNGRAVIITGLPYPPFKDPRVVLKQKYLEETRAVEKKGLTGQGWYKLEASRAVNQAIGRVIRHKDDYGAIILCDKRFGDNYFRTQLSTWVQPHMKLYSGFGPAVRDITQFFKSAQILLPQPLAKSNGAPAVSIKYEEPSLPFIPPVHARALQAASSRPVVLSDAVKRKIADARAGENDFSSECSMLPLEQSNSGLEGLQINGTTTINADIKTVLGGSKLGKEGNLFSALDKGSNIINFNQLNSSQISSKFESVKSNPKKKRIKVISKKDDDILDSVMKEYGNKSESAPQPNEDGPLSGSSGSSDITCAQRPSSSSTSLQRDKSSASSGGSAGSAKENQPSKVSSIALYLKEVKTSLGTEEYQQFSAAIKSYQKTKDYDSLIVTLVSVFITDPKMHRLFRKFRAFIIKEHRSKFDETCNDLLCPL